MSGGRKSARPSNRSSRRSCARKSRRRGRRPRTRRQALHARAGRAGLLGVSWPAEYGGPGALADGSVHPLGRDGQLRRAVQQRHGDDDGGADHNERGDGRAARRVAAEDAERRSGVRAGLHGAGRGNRPRGTADARRRGRGRLRRQRPKAVHQRGAFLVPRPGCWRGRTRRRGSIAACRRSLVPTDADGVSVRPLWRMDGGRTNEVFFDNVRIPRPESHRRTQSGVVSCGDGAGFRAREHRLALHGASAPAEPAHRVRQRNGVGRRAAFARPAFPNALRRNRDEAGDRPPNVVPDGVDDRQRKPSPTTKARR